ncbi:MAG: TonB-dependent receptor [Rudaea sp.]|nr:TonB-dependent receptor [Rudaea sp.]
MVLGLAASPVFAQSAASGPAPTTTSATPTQSATPAAASHQAQPGGLTDIVVTARRISEKLQDVPVSVTAFSGADLQRQNAVSVSDVANFTPGFTVVQSPSSPTALFLSLRGQVQGDALATLEPSVGTYIDGLYVARAYGLNADLLDISSAQILKGPQGTLFGRNTSAGALVLETNKPNLDKLTGDVRVGYGRFNDVDASAVINLPIVKDFFALRGAILVHERDGYITDSNTGEKYNNINNVTGRLKALWQPTPDFSIIASGEWFSYKTNGPARQLRYVTGTALAYEELASTQFAGLASVAPPAVAAALLQASTPPASQIGAYNTDPNSATLDDAPRTVTRTQTYSVTAQYDSAIGTLKAIGGYRRVTDFSNIDLDGTPYQILQTAGYQDLHQWSGELQLTGRTLHNRLEYAAGVTYFTEAGYDNSTANDATSFATFLGFAGAVPGVPAGTFIPNMTDSYDGTINNKSFGVYGQGTYHLTDQLSLTAGLRYSNDKKSLVTHNGNALYNQSAFISCDLPTLATLANDNCAAAHSNTFSKVSYTIGLDYKITPDVLVYIKAGRGYRSGGENLRANGDPATFAPFLPEINDEQEIGIKSEFFDRRLRVNIAAYHNVITDAQRELLLGVPGTTETLTELYNAQKQRTYGFEADAAAVLTRDITLNAGTAYTDPKYVTYTQPIAFGSSTYVDHSSDFFSYAPKWTFNAAIDLHHTFAAGRFHARGDLSYMSHYYGAPDRNVYSGTTVTPNSAAAIASFTTPSAAILGANVGMTFTDGLDVTVWGKNLTNNRDFTNNLYVSSLGMTTGTRREPVTYGITASYKF